MYCPFLKIFHMMSENVSKMSIDVRMMSENVHIIYKNISMISDNVHSLSV